MRVFLCKVLVVFLLCSYKTASAGPHRIGKAISGVIKVGGTAIVGLMAFGLFTGVRGCMHARALRNPDFLQMQDGVAINHYSHISRYDIEEKNPSVRDYLKIADKQDVALLLHLRDSTGNSRIATLVDHAGNTAEVRYTEKDGGGTVEVPLTQISGVALYKPDIYGRYVAVARDKLIPLYSEDSAELSYFYFYKYHALVLASFSDDFQLLRIFAAIDAADETIDNDGWLLGLDRSIDVVVRSEDIVYPQLQLE